MHVIFKPLGFSLFRWGGEYTWVVTGPYAEGVSEPLPLPTTFIGALLALKKGFVKTSGRVELNDLLEALEETFGEKIVIRGPFIPGASKVGLHFWQGGIAVYDGSVLRVHHVSKLMVPVIGTALRHNTRSVLEHYMYAAQMIDFTALEKLIPGLSSCLAIELYNTEVAEVKGVIRLGGETRAALVESRKGEPLKSLVEKVKEEDEVCCVYVVSPILLDADTLTTLLNRRRILLELGNEKVELRIPTLRELRNIVKVEKSTPDDMLKVLKMFRVKISLLSPGFDTIRASPRPTHPAIMPGSLLLMQPCSKSLAEALYEQGVGLWSRLGWGTVLPLPHGIQIHTK